MKYSSRIWDLKDEDYVVLENIRVTKKDMECLKPGGWLYDNVIEFNLQYQRRNYFRKCRDKIEILSPSIVQIIKFTTIKEIRAHLQPLKLLSKSIVIIPVNDGAMNGGGTHWSLLIFIPKENKFIHMDSLGTMNRHHAKVVIKKTLLALDKNCSNYSATYFGFKQANSYDCGLYVLYFGKIALKHFCCNRNSSKNFDPNFIILDSNLERQKVIQSIQEVIEMSNYHRSVKTKSVQKEKNYSNSGLMYLKRHLHSSANYFTAGLFIVILFMLKF